MHPLYQTEAWTIEWAQWASILSQWGNCWQRWYHSSVMKFIAGSSRNKNSVRRRFLCRFFECQLKKSGRIFLIFSRPRILYPLGCYCRSLNHMLAMLWCSSVLPIVCHQFKTEYCFYLTLDFIYTCFLLPIICRCHAMRAIVIHLNRTAIKSALLNREQMVSSVLAHINNYYVNW